MGKVICIGLGPGDPELMSVKAHRLLTGAQHVAFFRKPGRRGQARTIVDGIIAETAVEHANTPSRQRSTLAIPSTTVCCRPSTMIGLTV